MTLKDLIKNVNDCDLKIEKMHPDDVEAAETHLRKLLLNLRKHLVISHEKVREIALSHGMTEEDFQIEKTKSENKYAERIEKQNMMLALYTGIKPDKTLEMCRKYAEETYEATEDDIFYRAKSIIEDYQERINAEVETDKNDDEENE